MEIKNKERLIRIVENEIRKCHDKKCKTRSKKFVFTQIQCHGETHWQLTDIHQCAELIKYRQQKTESPVSRLFDKKQSDIIKSAQCRFEDDCDSVSDVVVDETAMQELMQFDVNKSIHLRRLQKKQSIKAKKKRTRKKGMLIEHIQLK